ncbi:MAG: 2-oxoacid:acceptor oxidoreductase family protein [Anaerohalosphaeraceae bacterium]|nr:2-oxoacid:acceptor oxidoreductase family protein [Anaerohalosphaeraceae bacterium]
MAGKETKILIAGFGGQGIILAGNVLAYACIDAGKNVCAMASYGAEVRGGTAKAIISISDEQIDSPIIETVNLAMIMNAPSFVRYSSSIEKDSPVIVNSSMIDQGQTERSDLDILGVDATNLAIKIGNIKVANIIMLGVMIKKTGILDPDSITGGLKRAFSGSKKGLYYINESAFRSGYDLY